MIQQSQSKLFGRFAVFFPSQCWCARFGELTAITNIGRTRRRARSTKQCWVEGCQLFLSETEAWIALSAPCRGDVDNGMKDKYSWISSAYVWILKRWFLTTLNLPDTFMINKIGPGRYLVEHQSLYQNFKKSCG